MKRRSMMTALCALALGAAGPRETPLADPMPARAEASSSEPALPSETPPPPTIAWAASSGTPRPGKTEPGRWRTAC